MLLPEYIAPLRFAQRQSTVGGEVDLAPFTRLTAPFRTAGRVSAEFRFFTDEHRRPRLSGSFHGVVTACCQRCLEDFELPVGADFNLLIVANESPAPDNEQDDDFIVVHDDRLNLRQLLEDELILALPMIPAHDAGVCKKLVSGHAVAQDLPGPFAVLATLKSGKS